LSIEMMKRIVQAARWGVLATSFDGRPRARPMYFVLASNGKLWSSTYKMSGKVREFASNKRVEICFVDRENNQLRVEGIVDMTGGPDKKKALLRVNAAVSKHFPDENAPQFVHIEIRPVRARWKPMGFSEYNEISLDTRAES